MLVDKSAQSSILIPTHGPNYYPEISPYPTKKHSSKVYNSKKGKSSAPLATATPSGKFESPPADSADFTATSAPSKLHPSPTLSSPGGAFEFSSGPSLSPSSSHTMQTNAPASHTPSSGYFGVDTQSPSAMSIGPISVPAPYTPVPSTVPHAFQSNIPSKNSPEPGNVLSVSPSHLKSPGNTDFDSSSPVPSLPGLTFWPTPGTSKGSLSPATVQTDSPSQETVFLDVPSVSPSTVNSLHPDSPTDLAPYSGSVPLDTLPPDTLHPGETLEPSFHFPEMPLSPGNVQTNFPSTEQHPATSKFPSSPTSSGDTAVPSFPPSSRTSLDSGLPSSIPTSIYPGRTSFPTLTVSSAPASSILPTSSGTPLSQVPFSTPSNSVEGTPAPSFVSSEKGVEPTANHVPVHSSPPSASPSQYQSQATSQPHCTSVSSWTNNSCWEGSFPPTNSSEPSQLPSAFPIGFPSGETPDNLTQEPTPIAPDSLVVDPNDSSSFVCWTGIHDGDDSDSNTFFSKADFVYDIWLDPGMQLSAVLPTVELALAKAIAEKLLVCGDSQRSRYLLEGVMGVSSLPEDTMKEVCATECSRMNGYLTIVSSELVSDSVCSALAVLEDSGTMTEISMSVEGVEAMRFVETGYWCGAASINDAYNDNNGSSLSPGSSVAVSLACLFFVVGMIAGVKKGRQIYLQQNWGAATNKDFYSVQLANTMTSSPSAANWRGGEYEMLVDSQSSSGEELRLSDEATAISNDQTINYSNTPAMTPESQMSSPVSSPDSTTASVLFRVDQTDLPEPMSPTTAYEAEDEGSSDDGDGDSNTLSRYAEPSQLTIGKASKHTNPNSASFVMDRLGSRLAPIQENEVSTRANYPGLSSLLGQSFSEDSSAEEGPTLVQFMEGNVQVLDLGDFEEQAGMSGGSEDSI